MGVGVEFAKTDAGLAAVNAAGGVAAQALGEFKLN